MIGSDVKVERIKNIAYRYFLDIGYEATTIRMICKTAEIESPTLYYFFKSKKGLFLSIRNDLVNDYKQKVEAFIIENDDAPAMSLKKFYMFCMDYSKNNPDVMRFYLRYRLFRPEELREEIEAYIEASLEEKRQIYNKFLKTCGTAEDKIVDDVFMKYINFIDSNTFLVIFSQWQPTDEEIEKAWNLFYENHLIDMN